MSQIHQIRSATIWRCGVVIFAMLAAVQFAIEIFNAPRVLQTGALSENLFKGRFLRERGPTTFVVDSVPTGSPLVEAGVLPGDRLRWDEPVGRWYNLPAGERASLTVVRGGATRKIEFTVPATHVLPRFQIANYVIDAAVKLGALLIGVLVGWRRPDLTAFRGLAAGGLLAGFDFPYSAPASAHFGWLDFVASVSQGLALAALVFFAVNYPDDKPAGWRATMQRYYSWYFGLLVAVTLFYYVRLYDGFYEPGVSWFFRTNDIVAPALFFWAILLAWRQTRGEARIRLQWMIATIGTLMAAVLVGNLNRLSGSPIPPEALGLFLNAAVLGAEAGFVYAVLRRRIFDFGLAVNRTLVFAVVSAILLGVFQIAHGIVGEFLHFDDKNKTILLSAVLAVAFYLSFTQLKKVVEKIVDRVFFNSWAVSEHDLKRFVAEAKHASDARVLAQLYVAALDRFTGGAGCAVYQRRPGDSYGIVETTLAGAPDAITANDEAILALLAHGKAVRPRDSSSISRAALAVPMAHRGELGGFVLLGQRHDGEPYRPDQVDLLEFTAHEVGLDFHVLKVGELANEVAMERRTSETLRAQLQTAMAIAKRDSLEGPP